MPDIAKINNHPYHYWHLEVSSKCSLKCPRCPRTEHPDKFVVTELTLDFVKNMFTDKILSNTKRVLFCGGEGDPIYAKDFLDIIQFFKNYSKDIQIIITTNGSYKTTKWWENLASMLTDVDSVIFSIDGWDNNSNNKYRVNSDYNSIINGIKTLRANNDLVRISWSTIIFKFNQDKIDDIISIANNAGASVFQLVKSSLFGSKIEKYIDKELGYDPLEPVDISDHSFHDRSYIKLDSYSNTKKRTQSDKEHIDKVKSLNNQYLDYFEADVLPGCLLGERALYVNAQGILFPCSWISHPFIKRSSPSRKKSVLWKDHLFESRKEDFNLHNYSVEEVLNSKSWNKIQEGFSCSNKLFVECEQKCTSASTAARLKSILNIKDISIDK